MQVTHCKEHPTQPVDTICFAPECQKEEKQLLCVKCLLQGNRHAQHPDLIEPLHPSSKTFRQLAELQRNLCMEEVFKQLKEVDSFAGNLETAILDEFRQWRFKRLSRLQCLINFFSKSELPRILTNLQEKADTHEHCCLGLVNALHKYMQYGRIDPSKVDAKIAEKILSGVKSLLFKSNNIKEIFVQMIQNLDYEKINLATSNIKEEIQFRTTSFEYILYKCLKDEKVAQEEHSIEILDTSMSGDFKKQFSLNSEYSVAIDELPPFNEQDVSLSREQGESMENRKPKKYIADQLASLQKKKKKKMDVQSSHESDDQNEGKAQLSSVSEVESSHDSLAAQETRNLASENILASSNISSFSRKSKNISCIEIPENSTEIEMKSACKLEEKGKGNNSSEQNPNIFRIERGAKIKDVMKYLSENKVNFLIINEPKLTKEKQLEMIIEDYPNIFGLHIECQHFLSKDFVEKSKVFYITFIHNYRFLPFSDNSTSFPTEGEKKPEKIDIFNKQKGSFTAYNKNEMDLILDNTEQLNICNVGWQKEFPINRSNIKSMTLKCNNLVILSFSDISFNKNVKLEETYARNTFLHTLVFKNCVLELDSIASEFSCITVQNFHHLQISNNNSDKKLLLSHKNFKKICNLVKLKTLILVGIHFKETDQKMNKNNVASKYFDEVNQLSELTHVNLCSFVVTKDGSTIVTTKFLKNLSQKCLANMKTLNIEHCSIGEQSTQFLSKMVQLKNLSIGYTKIDGKDLIEFIKYMPELEQLSIEYLNGDFQGQNNARHSNEKEKYGYVFPKHLKHLKDSKIRYLNIRGCQNLKSFNWNILQELRYLLIGSDQINISSIAKLRERDIKIIEKQNRGRTSNFLEQFLSTCKISRTSSRRKHLIETIEINDSSEQKYRRGDQSSLGRKKRQSKSNAKSPSVNQTRKMNRNGNVEKSKTAKIGENKHQSQKSFDNIQKLKMRSGANGQTRKP